jgi:bacteriophage N4 adsorption protein B
MSEILFAVWFFFRVFFIFLLFVFVLFGLDDLWIDVVYYVRAIYRGLFRRKRVRPVTLQQLKSVPEKPIAIMVPAWDESAVIGRMLRHTLKSVIYRDFRIFVGTYPNDEATRREVQKVREEDPRVELVTTPAPGPTNKADCLNWVLQGIRVFEKDHGMEFAIFLMHDAEDVIHPLSLLYYNYLMPRIDFVQVPVFPFPAGWKNFTTGVYMDEFAENHTKLMRVRELIAGALPSAGVGTALSRRCLDHIAAERENQVFDISSVTEDYLMGLRLQDFPGKKIFLQQEAGIDPSLNSRAPIATREFFPSSFRASVRQKSRWIMGISLQGCSYGCKGKLGTNYFIFRDRKAALSNLVVALGYILIFFWLAGMVINCCTELYLPPLIERGEIYAYLVYLVLFIFLWRIANRIYASWKIYGPLHGVLAVPRLFWGNIINFCATWLALKRYIHARRTGTVPEWGKTAHAFPTEEQMRRYHKRLGDILLEMRMVRADQLEAALEEQKETGKRLGDILIDSGELELDDLRQALREQREEDAGGGEK